MYQLKKSVNKWGNKWRMMDTMSIQPVGRGEIKSIIDQMKNGTSFGRDRLDINSIKSVSDLLCDPICHIVNLSIVKKTFPMKWKTARIIPLSKGHGSVTSSPAGYRPIAMLPVLSKICERVVQQQISRHMKKNKLWNQNGHAYKEDHSTSTALLQLSDLIYMGGGQE